MNDFEKMLLNDFKTRLLNEQSELSERVKKLKAFLQTEHSKEIDATQLILLNVQINAMETYLTVLTARIGLLK